MSRPITDEKVYEVRLYRNRDYLGDLGKLARDLTWTVNRNPQIGYNTLSFKVDQLAFDNWCKGTGVQTDDIVRPMNTDCQIWVRNTPMAEPVCVAHGYLYAMPTGVPNGDAMDYRFEFKDQFLKLQGASRIPNGTRYTLPANQMVMKLISDAQNRQNPYRYGFTVGLNPSLPTITREYNDWKPVSEAVAEMCDNSTGAGQFDVWIDQDYKVNVAKPRGQDSGLVFHYPYDPTLTMIPMASAPTYEQIPELMTVIRAVGEGQGDAAITTLIKDDDAIEQYGYIEGYQQYSSITNLNTLNQKAQADLDNAINPNPAPTISVNGVFINWETFGVGDLISYVNEQAVGYGLAGTVRVATITVNCDGNRNESVQLTTEVWNGQ